MSSGKHPCSDAGDQSRRAFLRRAGVALGAAVVAAHGQAGQPAPRARKPNVIFLFADQMRAHVLGCYGNRQVPTPNLDRLAREGVVCDNAISTWPVCSPYRAMLLTGRYPMANGTVVNDTGVKHELPSVATAFRKDGYATGYIGKWHLEWNRHPYVPKDRRMGFDYWAVCNCAHDYLNAIYCGDSPEPIHIKGYEPLAQTELAVRYIRAHREAPFCLFVSWGTPHDPYRRQPPEYRESFPVERIELRPNVSERAVVHKLLATDPGRHEEKLAALRARRRETYEDDALLRQQLQGYYAHSKALDDCVGTLLDALDATGLAEDTILVFSSDHGDMLGSHRMGSKQMPLEESIRIPFIIRYPRGLPTGRRTDALLAPIDIMPTLLALAGVPAPPVDGQDLSEILKGARDDTRDALLIMKMLPGGNPYMVNGVTPWRGVRTKQYTYARLLDRGPWLLYDNREDPLQLHNRIDDPAYADIREMLDRRTDELLLEAGDPNDTAAIDAYRAKRARADKA